MLSCRPYILNREVIVYGDLARVSHQISNFTYSNHLWLVSQFLLLEAIPASFCAALGILRLNDKHFSQILIRFYVDLELYSIDLHQVL